MHKLDVMVISHNDADHSGGMRSVLAQMPVDWLASSLPDSLELNADVERMKCFTGQHWVWDGVVFQMLGPQFESYDNAALIDNNRSCVLKITAKSGSLLLTGDIEQPVEHALLERSLPALQKDAQQDISLKSDVMIAPHHGSKTSSSVQFINAVQPELTIFTAGYLNRFKHPGLDVVKRYTDASSKVLRSDYHGAVVMDFTAASPESGFQAKSWRTQNKRYWHDVYE